MNDEHIGLLRQALAGLRADLGRAEQAGRGLGAAELRRTASLRRAAELVQQAVDTLASGEAQAPPRIRYRGDPPVHPYDVERGAVEEFGLAGDDDTPGWRRRPGASGKGRDDGGAEET